MPCLPIHFLIIVHLHPFGTHSALIQHSSQYMQAQSAPIRHSFSTHSALIVIHASPFSTHSALISIHPFSTHLNTCKPNELMYITHLTFARHARTPSFRSFCRRWAHARYQASALWRPRTTARSQPAFRKQVG